jgi:hypothetical protein
MIPTKSIPMVTSANGSRQQQTIIFLHIPKAAGSTLQRIIEEEYSSPAIFKIDGSCIQQSIDDFKQLPESQRASIAALMGHMGFGLHQFLPQPATYITLLRDPVERVISDYYYVLRSPNHYRHYEVTAKNMSLKEYVVSGISTETNNCQTRRLSGAEQEVLQKPFVSAGIAFGECPVNILKLAKENLRQWFAVVGLVERFDKTLILLRRAFGWRVPLYVKKNVTKDRPSKADISRAALSAIEEYNQLDIELYRYARGLFQDTINQQAGAFKWELCAFKLLNKVYGRYRLSASSRPVDGGREIIRVLCQRLPDAIYTRLRSFWRAVRRSE